MRHQSPEQIAAKAVYDRVRYASGIRRMANPDSILATQAARLLDGRAYTSSRKWKAANPISVAYSTQKANARRRGIEWLFTMKSWLTFWGDQILLRGKAPDALCCARKGDTGPYSPENCERITMSANGSQGNVTKSIQEQIYAVGLISTVS